MRLDDLSTYEKIAFYKLVSRKELEGIADEGGRKGAGEAKGAQGGRGGEVCRGTEGNGQVREGERSGGDEDEEEREKGRRGAPSYIRAKRSEPSSERCKVAGLPLQHPVLPFPSSWPPPTPYKERHKLPRNLVSSDIKDFPITLAVLRD